MSKKIIIAVGGTGGHIYPGIALAEKIKEKYPDSRISFIIDKRPLAFKVLSQKGYSASRITACALPRKKFWNICKFLVKMSIGLIECIILLKKRKPDCIAAFGAYLSVPVVIGASILKIPVVIHEQNYFPGLANKFLGSFADRIAVSYRSSIEHFPAKKTVLTGNPVRKELFEVDKDAGRDHFGLNKDKVTVFVFGGSLGSESINIVIIEILPYLESMAEQVQFIHVCGNKNRAQLKEEYVKYGFSANVYAYLDDIRYAYAASDIIIARSGATTVAEITALGIPSLLIPYPEATSQHQVLNTLPLCNIGGAICCNEEKLSGEGLALRVLPLIRDAEKRREMSMKMMTLKKRFIEASEKLAEVIINEIKAEKQCLKK
ncbi:MAG: undecaprenyldiphospho-muramoylpentapeptide beta-N-acetylglucosaminyltransferase [Elusimicrobiota bacterium]